MERINNVMMVVFLLLLVRLCLNIVAMENSQLINSHDENNVRTLNMSYFVDESIRVDIDGCKVDGWCASVQLAFDAMVQSSEYSDFVSMLNDTSSKGVVIATFRLMSDSNNFCGFNFNLGSDLTLELHFVSLLRENVKLTCNGQNFIQNQSDISYISYEKCNLYGVNYNFDQLISFTISNSYFNDSDFKYYPRNDIQDDVKSTTLEIVNSTVEYFAIVYSGNLVIENSSLLDSDSHMEVNMGNYAQLHNYEVAALLRFSKIQQVTAANGIIDQEGKIFVRDFETFKFTDSNIKGTSLKRPKLYLQSGAYALLQNANSTSNRQVISIIDVKDVLVDHFSMMNSEITRECFYTCSLLTFNCANVNITNSYFARNKGSLYGGSVYVNNYVTAKLDNNIFQLNRGHKGGALFLGYCQPDMTTYCWASVTNNIFENNYSAESGGGMFILFIAKAQLSNNTFIGNNASISGGAVHIEYVKELEVSDSTFIRNRVLLESYSQRKDDSIGYVKGGGGAISVLGIEKTGLISGCKFLNNKASKGGALLFGRNQGDENPKSLIISETCTFNRNTASLGAEGYLSNLKSTGSSFQFKKPPNTEFMSAPSVFKLQEVSVKEVVPGKPLTLKLLVHNFFGDTITDLSKIRIMYDIDQDIVLSLNFSTDSTIQITPYPVQKEIGALERSLTLYSEDSQYFFNVSFTFVKCPQMFTMDDVVISGQPAVECIPEQVVLSRDFVILVAVPTSIAVLILGISIGLFSLYVLNFISVRMWRLKKKEKAELELEMRIIDKKVIFQNSMGSSQSTLSETAKSKQSNNSDLSVPLIEKNEKPSFIIPIENIEIVRKLAEGGLGIVYLGKLVGKIDVAIKLLKSTDQGDEFEQEASLLSSLRHDNILTLFGICVTSENKYMVTEFAEMGSLDKSLYRARIGEITLPLKNKLSILIATAKGIEYLHNLTPTVVHRDLKPGNILLDKKSVAKICDFGLSRTISNSMNSVLTTNLGTLFYCPSEVLEGPSESNMASRQTATMIDVYSFAIIMWEVFFEVIPYSSSFKLTRMYETNNEEERLWSNVSLFNIPGLVVKGLRPIIPFKTEDQIFKWISEYMLPEEKTSPNIVPVVMKYFEIVKRNWDHNATLRSPISNIRSDLEDLLALLEMN